MGRASNQRLVIPMDFDESEAFIDRSGDRIVGLDVQPDVGDAELDQRSDHGSGHEGAEASTPVVGVHQNTTDSGDAESAEAGLVY